MEIKTSEEIRNQRGEELRKWVAVDEEIKFLIWLRDYHNHQKQTFIEIEKRIKQLEDTEK